MTRRRSLFGAAVGMALLLGGLSPLGTLRAQTSQDEPPSCPAAVDELGGVEIATRVTSPTNPAEPSRTATVPIGATFENKSERRALPTDPLPRIKQIEARIYACQSGQLIPEPSTQMVNGPVARSMSISFDPVFETNGPYAVEFKVSGDRTGTPPQTGRYVMGITLAVPPKKPTGVEATVSSNGTVTVSWSNADAEKDLVAYEVLRAREGSADYTTVKNGLVAPSVKSVSDTPDEGVWKYRVTAYRNGVDEGSTSEDETVRVVASAPTGVPATPGDGSGSSGAGTTGTATTVAGSSPSSSSASELAAFAAALNARRRAAQSGRIQPPDGGFDETLPFDAPREELGEAQVGAEDEPEELGADEPNVGVGQRLVSDPGDRRRSFAFVAFGFLLFVLSMTGLFVKSEVKRADQLDAELDVVDVVDVDAAAAAAAVPVALPVRSRRRRPSVATEPSPPPVPEPEPVHHFADLLDAPAQVSTRRRRAAEPLERPTVTPLDSPGLDVPDPVVTTRTTRTPTHARRTATRLPPRPANDRRQGRAAVRPRSRGAGQGDGRVPVGRS